MPRPSAHARRPASEIGPSVVFHGEIDGEGSLVIHGRIEGNVRVRGDVTLAEEGRCDGEIESDSLLLLGEVTGSVRTATRLEIGPKAFLRGDFETPRLRFHRGARMHGRARMRPRAPGEAPP